MKDNAKIKSAFMTLLADFKADIGDYSEFGYCYTSCPFRNDDACPAIVYEEYSDCEYDECEIDEKKCREAIFNYYLENVHD